MHHPLVIYQCALKRDLELFEAGDSTEVGEKGLTLRYVLQCCVWPFWYVTHQSNLSVEDRRHAYLQIYCRKG